MTVTPYELESKRHVCHFSVVSNYPPLRRKDMMPLSEVLKAGFSHVRMLNMCMQRAYWIQSHTKSPETLCINTVFKRGVNRPCLPTQLCNLKLSCPLMPKRRLTELSGIIDLQPLRNLYWDQFSVNRLNFCMILWASRTRQYIISPLIFDIQ